MSKFMLEEGADSPSFIIVLSSPQDKMDPLQPRYINMFPEKPIMKGEAVNIDAGPSVYACTIGFNRWTTLGRPTSRFKK
jgi:hypothetical protein